MAGIRADHPDALDRPTPALALIGQQQIDAFLQRRQCAAEHIGPAAVEQFVCGQQGMQFVGAEPESGQLELVALQSVVEEAGIGAQQRRVQDIAQKPDIPVQGGARTAQFLFQRIGGNRITCGFQTLVQGEYTVITVHCLT